VHHREEDGLQQRLRSHRHRRRSATIFIALCLGLCLTLYGPLAAAQNFAASSNLSAAQLRLAEQQGDAETAILNWVLANSGPLTGDTHAGSMRIAFTITAAEGWWDKAGGGKLAWHEAPAGNVHLRIFVLDADGRLIPGLTPRATFTDANGNEQSGVADFGWYPLINAYGGNVPITADSSYTLRVAIDEGPSHHLVSVGDHSEHTTIAVFPPVPIAQPVTQNAQPSVQSPQTSALPRTLPNAQPHPQTMAQNTQPTPAQPLAPPPSQNAQPLPPNPPPLPRATAVAAANEAELLKPCNAALAAALTALWQQSIAGAEKPDDNYFVAYALGIPGLSIALGGSRLHVKNLASLTKDDVRLQLLARDSRTGRIIPGLKAQASLIDADGDSYGPGDLSLVWFPWLTHYAGDARVPRKGLYTLRVHFDAPAFRRWGRQSERFAAPADVVFENISLKPEKKD
jgi:hypothetical protein